MIFIHLQQSQPVATNAVDHSKADPLEIKLGNRHILTAIKTSLLCIMLATSEWLRGRRNQGTSDRSRGGAASE